MVELTYVSLLSWCTAGGPRGPRPIPNPFHTSNFKEMGRCVGTIVSTVRDCN
jgi:hypothetical protein